MALSTSQWPKLGYVPLGVLCAVPRPAAAHDPAHSAGPGFDGLVVITTVILLSALTGIAAIALRSRFESPARAARIHRLSAGLFIGIGLTATGSVVITRMGTGLAAGSIGLLLGAALITQRSSDAHVTAAIGSIAVHRFVEGGVLAVLLSAGQTVSRVGILVLLSHAAAECVSLGLYPKISRLQAAGAIFVVTFGFASGIGLGTLGLAVTGPIVVDGAIAAGGGVLTVLGLSELCPQSIIQLQHRLLGFTRWM